MPTLEVVHAALHPPSTTVVDSASKGLSEAVTGITNTFTVEARDAFGNIRAGDDTPNFSGGYGDGKSDFFLVELTGPDGYQVVTSSAVQTITTNSTDAGGSFRLAFAGKTSLVLPAGVSSSAMDTALETMFGEDPHTVEVSRTDNFGGAQNSGYTWTVTFTSHLDELYPDLASVGIEVLPPAETSSTNDASLTMSVGRPASGGYYPVEYTLWYKGTYELAITSNNEHVEGSPFTVEVDDGAVFAESTTAEGQGLVGGVAGDPFVFTVQAMDVRTTEIQTIRTEAFVVPMTSEVQFVDVSTEPAGTGFFLRFRGAKTDNIQLGTATYQDAEDLLNALPTVNGVDVVPPDGSVMGDSVTIADGGFYVEFTYDYGDVPMLVGSGSVTVSEEIKGDTAYRKETQAFTCMCDDGAASYITITYGDEDPITVDGTTTATQLETAFSAFTDVSVVVNGSTLVCPDNTPGSVYITFNEETGDLPLLTIDSSNLNGAFTQYTQPVDGNVNGIHPVWGTFTLMFDGEETEPLSTDASAAEVEAALEALDNIGDVTVWKDDLGLSMQDAQGVLANDGALFSTWTVEFDGLCTLGGEWANCPNNVGDLPLMTATQDMLEFEPSYVYNQHAPSVTVREIRPGSTGNTREDGNDLDAIAVTLTHETEADVSIGVYEVQTIRCFTVNSTKFGGANNDGMSFELTFFNEGVAVQANTTLADLEALIETFTYLNNVTVTSPNGQGTVCADEATDLYVTFETEKLTQPTFGVRDAVNVQVFTGEAVQGIDSITYLGGTTGQYEVVYTPRIKGNYSIAIEVDGVEIESDLSSGVYVLPAAVSAPQTAHDARLVATEDVTEPFTIQATDRFGNHLDGGIGDAAFLVTLNGTAHEFSGKASDAALHYFMGVVDEFTPNTDGIFYPSYFPELAGPHVLSVELRSAGGLLATYFKNPDLTGEVLGDNADGLFPFHDPAWCPPSLLDCDSTRLDATIDFDWGSTSPLSHHEFDA